MRACLAAFSLIVLLIPSSAAGDDYVVTLTDRFPRRARVEARLTPDQGIVRLRDNEASGLLHGWSTFIVGLEAQDEQGRDLDLQYEPTGRWVVPGPGDRPVRVRYWMNLQHDQFPTDAGDGAAAYWRPYGVMWTGRALFLTGRDTDAITVRFTVPEAWDVLTPWPADPRDDRLFRVPATRDLVNAAVFAGTPQTAVVTVGQITARFALGGEHVATTERVLGGVIRDYLTAYADLFGVTPEAAVSVIATEHATWSGGVLGHTISLTMGSPPGPENWSLWGHVVAHELLHLWTGALRMAGAERSRLEWLIEGFAEYRASLEEFRRGDIDEAAFLAALAAAHGRYLARYGRVPITHAGDGPDADPELVTSGGTVMAMVFDLQIRHATAGTRGLDDLMRRVYRGHTRERADATPLDRAAVLEAFRAETGEDATAFVARHVDGIELIPLQQALAHAGLRVTIEGHEDGPPTVQILREANPSTDQQAVWRAVAGRP